MVKLQDAISKKTLATASELLTLWVTLDSYSKKSEPVVITRKGEIIAGNVLGFKATINRGIHSL